MHETQKRKRIRLTAAFTFLAADEGCPFVTSPPATFVGDTPACLEPGLRMTIEIPPEAAEASPVSAPTASAPTPGSLQQQSAGKAGSPRNTRSYDTFDMTPFLPRHLSSVQMRGHLRSSPLPSLHLHGIHQVHPSGERAGPSKGQAKATFVTLDDVPSSGLLASMASLFQEGVLRIVQSQVLLHAE